MPTPRKPSDKQMRKEFAIRLKAARISAGFEHARDLADEIGCEHETYRRYERAETEPSIAALSRIARATESSLDFLVSGEITRPSTRAQRGGK